MCTTQEPRHDIGRAVLPRRFGIKAAQQRSPTGKRFMVTKRVIIFRKGAAHEPCERCAAFMPLQCGICEGIRIVPMLLDVLTLRRNKFRDPRIMGTKRVNFRKRVTQEPCGDFGRAVLPRRLDIKAVQQHSPTRKRFMVTKRVIVFRKSATQEPSERCAAFMPLQCDNCEGIQIVPMLQCVPTLRRNKFRDPQFMGTKHVNFRKRVTQEPCGDFGRAALLRRLDMKAVRQHSPTRKRFMVTKRVIIFRKGATQEPSERCAAFMPLQCNICQGIRIVPMLLDVLTLRRNKFRDPRIMGTRRVNF